MKKTLILLLSLFFTESLCQAQQEAQIVQDYIDQYKEIAINNQIEYGVPASIILAQAINESDVGRSYLATSGNNHFGIKCSRKWSGATIRKTDDRVNECFRKYESSLNSFADHANFLTRNARYKFLFQIDPKDYNQWAHGLKSAGYATSPTYASKLISTIERYDLGQYTLLAIERERNNSIKRANTISASLENDSDASFQSTAQYALYTPTTRTENQNVISTNNSSERPQVKAALSSPKNTATTMQKIPWDSTFEYNGLKAFYLEKGKSLLPISRYFDISLNNLLSYNDLESDIVPESSYMYLESKKKKGIEEKVVIEEENSMWYFSQLYSIRLKQLCRFNNLNPQDVPEAGETLYLQDFNPNKVATLSSSSNSSKTNVERMPKDNSLKSKEDPDYDQTPNFPSPIAEDKPKKGESINSKNKSKRVKLVGNNSEKESKKPKASDDESTAEELNFDELVHVVTEDQDLDIISVLYRVNKNDIMDYNNLNSERVYTGQKLLIPPPDYKTINETLEEKAAENEQENEIEVVKTVEVVDPPKTEEQDSKEEDDKNDVDVYIEKTKKTVEQPVEETTKDEKVEKKASKSKNLNEGLDKTVSKKDNTEELFLYEKNGRIKKFSIENLPDDSWTFVGRYEGEENAPKPEVKSKKEKNVAEKTSKAKTETVNAEDSKPRRSNSSSNGEESQSKTYTVQNGDNMFRIAKKFGVSIDDIMIANRKTEPTVFLGEKLFIPGPAKNQTSSKSSNNTSKKSSDKDQPKLIEHTVTQGENLYRISVKYNVKIDAIKKWNNLDSDEISIGQTLKIYQ